MMRVNVLEEILNKHSDEDNKFRVDKVPGHYEVVFRNDIANVTDVPADIDNNCVNQFQIDDSSYFDEEQLTAIKKFAETPIKQREPFKPKNALERLRYRLILKDDSDNQAYASKLVDGDLANLSFISFGQKVICYFNYDEESLFGETPEPDALFMMNLNDAQLNWINTKTSFAIKNVISDFVTELHEQSSFDRSFIKPYEESEEED